MLAHLTINLILCAAIIRSNSCISSTDDIGPTIGLDGLVLREAKGNLMNDAYSKFHPDLLEMKTQFRDSKIAYRKE